MIMNQRGVRLGEVEIALARIGVSAEKVIQFLLTGTFESAIEKRGSQLGDALETFFQGHARLSLVSCFSTH